MEDYEVCEYLALSVGRKTATRGDSGMSLLHGAAGGMNNTLAAASPVTTATSDATTSASLMTLAAAAGGGGGGDGDFLATAGSLEELKYYLYGYVNPVICGFGLLGNLLNIIVLTRRRMQAAMDSNMERTARYNLIALALSDMLYCAVTFPRAFLSSQIVHQSHETPQLYLRVYGSTLQSIFMYTSTWLTVILAVGRYAAICRPIETRYLSDTKFTIAGIVSAFILCILFHLPTFWTYRILRYDCTLYPADGEGIGRGQLKNLDEVYGPDRVYYNIDTGYFVANKRLKTTFTYAWFVCGYLVPVALLFYCNAHLVHALRASQRVRAMYRVSPKAPVTFSWRVTATLIAIVCMFIVLVSPAEILRFYYYAVGREDVEIFNMAVVVTNVLLTTNFGCNFILYCAVNAHFRNTWCHCLKCATAAQHRKGGARHKRCRRRYTFTRSTPGSCCRRSGAALLTHGGPGGTTGVTCPCGGPPTDSRALGGCSDGGYTAAVSLRCADDVTLPDVCKTTYIELARVNSSSKTANVIALYED